MMKGLMKRIGGFELSFTKRLHRGQKGFTLMELLIVVATLGVLAAGVIPRFTGLIGEGESEAAATEHEVVQTALTAAMAANGVSSVTPGGGADTVLGPGTDDPTEAPIGTYLQTTTGWGYSWDAEGDVTQGNKQ